MCASDWHLAGILVIGGSSYDSASQSAEFWLPEQGGCVLNDYPRKMYGGQTLNLVSGGLVACYLDTCDIYQEGSWQHLQNTTATRTYQSSATTEDAVLLIGGGHSNTTEWIPVNGSPVRQGPFTVRHESSHCTIQISADIIVVTGGHGTEDYVTQYQLADGNETPLTSMGQPRYDHACGVYQDPSGQQVSESERLCSYNQCDVWRW